MTSVRPIDAFESRSCTRCGGCGLYSWTPRWGSTCFKCGTQPHVPGSGFVLTKLGAQAHEAWLAANTDTIPAGNLTPGDTISEPNGRRYRVLTIDRGSNYGRGGHSENGAPMVWTEYDIQLHTSDGYTRPMSSNEIVHRWVAGRYALPPVMDPGTKRGAEMRVYIAGAAAVHEAVPA